MINHVFPVDGEYDFRIARGGAGLGQTLVGGDEELEMSVDGERVLLVGRNAGRDIRLPMRAGPRALGIAIIKKHNARGVNDLFDVINSAAGVSTVGRYR